MQYRTFGKLDWQVSALGFGCARFPVVEKEYANIDEEEAIRMLRCAIDHGVNYLDTAYNYHGENSERLIGKALRDGYREKARVATKLPCWLVEKREDCDRFLDEQLEKLQTDHIDVYLLHGLNGGAKGWPRMRDMGVIEWAERAMAKGLIGCLGFSFHDNQDAFQEIVDGYDN
jgi:predicted aldo/keto reductase-like oxidoreductase